MWAMWPLALKTHNTAVSSSKISSGEERPRVHSEKQMILLEQWKETEERQGQSFQDQQTLLPFLHPQ